MTTPRTTAKNGSKSAAGSAAGNGAKVRRVRAAPAPAPAPATGPVAGHCDELLHALAPFRDQAGTAQSWGERLARVLAGGGRLLAAGNGGSAAQAQHLTAELVGRYRDDRPPFSAIALHADTSSTTAIANDYGVDEVFARQVRAHGREGDVLMLLSTSGASANLLSAAEAGREAGMSVWALTGPAPNPLAAGSDESLCVRAGSTATVQELHLVTVHMVCAAFDAALEGVLEGGSADDAADA
ncbi:SIS domain-containing protein [Streptomyces chitinivorans]|uniref:SIS domain-containing protein n=1 Tax=Streptomyces chitinivorans TaxID=1257027 RepID=A0ABW7I1R0_9ACTN|nr:SIS domain-containing protein [Streptomyces chitinivorans]MDH2407906.1 SIS domain-containing protein [Streptomyces chitinivorans]